MIKAICFDLDGVFFTTRGMESFTQALVRLCSNEDQVRYAIFKSEEMKQFKSGKISASDYWDFVNVILNLRLSESEYSDLLINDYEIEPQVLDYVLKVRQLGYKTCICTNNFSTRIEALEHKFQFLQHFDVQVISYREGVLKPAKEIFEKLVTASGVNADEIAYSDDNEDKLAGAKELGIQTFVYESFRQFEHELRVLGVNL